MSALLPLQTAPRAPALGAKPAGTLAGRTPQRRGGRPEGIFCTMKNSKKLTILGLSAATALVAATGAVSSFAWFAANGTVEANGMTIKALAADAYLQICNSTENFDKASNSYTSAASATKEAQVLTPAHLYSSVSTENNGGVEYDGTASRVWVTGHSKSVDSGALDGAFTKIDNGALGQYVSQNEFKLRLRPAANGTQPTAALLDISVSWVNTSIPATDTLRNSVSVLVSNDSKGQLFTNSSARWAATEDTKNVQVVTGLTSDIQTVKVSVFFDGNNPDCKSANVLAGVQYSVAVTFSIHQ